MSGWIKYMMVVPGLTTDRCLTAVYYHNFFGENFWTVEHHKTHFPNLNSFNVKEIIEVDRDAKMIGFVNLEI